jgi:hypothetical protein
MIVDLGNINVPLLRKQTELVAELTDDRRTAALNDSERDLMEGIWNLLGHILDRVDPVPLEDD